MQFIVNYYPYILISLIIIVWIYAELWIYPRKVKSKDRLPTVLWLDDVRDPFKAKWVNTITAGFPHLVEDFEVVWVMSYDGFVNHVRFFGLPDAISFDHDLGPGKSGYDCAKWLVDYCMDHKFPIPQYRVHSSNPVGKENIESYLENAKKYLE